MIRSLVVILVPVVVITLLFTRTPEEPPLPTLDWRGVLATARAEAPYRVLAPAGLPDSWQATSASWTKVGEPYRNGEPSARNSWRLGFLDPSRTYIGLEQGDLRPDDMVARVSRNGVVDGRSTVEGRAWERRVSPDDRTRSLVWVTPEVTTIVVGDTGYEALEAYASTLRTS